MVVLLFQADTQQTADLHSIFHFENSLKLIILFIRFFFFISIDTPVFHQRKFIITRKKTTERSVVYADNTFLPLRRRAASTLRPFAVLIRLRKPCTLLRLRLFGW